MPTNRRDQMNSNDEHKPGVSSLATPIEKRFQRIATPFQEFVQSQTAGGVILVVSTVVALAIANSVYEQTYLSFFESPFGVYFGDLVLERTLHHWINDALMALFFFVLGLEIKREVLVGELQELKKSVPIVLSALGGMLVPAGIYYALNVGSTTARGWGIPMATDTAFALGVLAFLRAHTPRAVTTFLVALAIVDDIGAVLVIALFYTEHIVVGYLIAAGCILIVLVFFNLLGIRRPLIYFFLGALVWFFVLHSGVHATIAGILVALVIPARPRYSPSGLLMKLERLTEALRRKQRESTRILADEEQHAVVQNIRDTARMAMTPLQRWENALERPVALFVIPIFAFANIGIPLTLDSLAHGFAEPVTQGIFLGLAVGKVVGIVGLCWAGIKMKLGKLPEGMHMAHVVGVGLLGGMGFTMSIFMSVLSYSSLPALIVFSKLGILGASFLSGICGYLWLRFISFPSVTTDHNDQESVSGSPNG